MSSVFAAPWTLSRTQRLAYSVGHVFNDLCASMWFTYLLVYFHQVKSFNNKLAGALMLLGQVADGIATPLVGMESDNTKGFGRLGPRKTWHLIGTILVMASFPFIFNKCIECEDAPDWAQAVYYAPFIVIFQIGWAATQINHLILSAELAEDDTQRTNLIGYRNISTVLSSLSVYLLTWLFLALQKDNGILDTNELTHADSDKFRNITLVVIGLGAIFSFFFHVGTPSGLKNNQTVSEAREKLHKEKYTPLESIEQSMLAKRKMSWTCWFREPQFYLVGLAFMCTRLFVNISMVYIPMYLEETLKLPKDSIAQIPLIILGGNTLATIIISVFARYVFIDRKVWMLLGCLLAAGTSVWLWFIPKGASHVQMYGAAVVLGFAGGTCLVTMNAMVGDFIGPNKESGGFVFGAFSFCDKLSNGVAVQIIQIFHPCIFLGPVVGPAPILHQGNCCDACDPYYRMVQTFIPGGASVLLLISLLLLLPQKIGQRKPLPVLKTLKSPASYGSMASNGHANGGPCYTRGPETDSENSYTGSSNSDDEVSSPLLRASINSPPKDMAARV